MQYAVCLPFASAKGLLKGMPRHGGRDICGLPQSCCRRYCCVMFQKNSRHGEGRVVLPTRAAPFQPRKKVTVPLDGLIYSRDDDGAMLLLSLETKNEEEVEGRTDEE